MDLHDIKNIYEKMADARSGQIFINRLLYSITGNPSYLQDVIRASRRGNMFITELEKASGGRVLFGTGIWGREIFRAFPDAGWKFWTDSSPQMEVLYRMPVVPFAEFMQSYHGESVVVTSRLYHQQMEEQLLHAGVPLEKVINAGQLLDSFLPEDILELPEMILSYHPGYQFYMRHYSLAAFDTVLYAVPGTL